jgi:uncharacterized membrane protein
MTEETAKSGTAWPQARIENFTDSVFAFAVTLLVFNMIQINLPEGNQPLFIIFRDNLPTLITFGITFAIVARFWTSHVRLFGHMERYDRKVVDLNLILLFFISIFPFLAIILGNHLGNRDAVILYAACFGAIGFVEYFIGTHAYQAGLLIASDRTQSFLSTFTLYALTTPIIFTLSIGVALFSPTIAEILWLLLFFIRIGFRYYFRNSNNTKAALEVENL